MSIADLRSLIRQLREKWPSPDAECLSSEFTPDDWLRHLWIASTTAGVRLQAIPQIIPRGRTAFQVRLLDWIDNPEHAIDAWTKYWETLALIEIELDRIENPTSRDSDGRPIRKQGKGGRNPIESEAAYLKRLTKHERETIELKKTRKAVEIDKLMQERGVKVVLNGVETNWKNGNAKRIIDKYTKWKKRRDSATE